MNVRSIEERRMPALIVALLAVIGLGFALTSAPAVTAHERPVDITIRLEGAPGIPDTHGRANFHSRGGEQSLSVVLRATPRLGGETVVVMLGGRDVARIQLNDRGDGRVHLSTASGDLLPESVSGLSVHIVYRDAVRIASGTFPDY